MTLLNIAYAMLKMVKARTGMAGFQAQRMVGLSALTVGKLRRTARFCSPQLPKKTLIRGNCEYLLRTSFRS